jgi:hypothetical protein
MSAAIVVGSDEGERLARPGVCSHRVLAELPELEAIELSFEFGLHRADSARMSGAAEQASSR